MTLQKAAKFSSPLHDRYLRSIYTTKCGNQWRISLWESIVSNPALSLAILPFIELWSKILFIKVLWHYASVSSCFGVRFHVVTHRLWEYLIQSSMLTCCVDTSRSCRLLSSSTVTVSCISWPHSVLSWFISQVEPVSAFEWVASVVILHRIYTLPFGG